MLLEWRLALGELSQHGRTIQFTAIYDELMIVFFDYFIQIGEFVYN